MPILWSSSHCAGTTRAAGRVFSRRAGNRSCFSTSFQEILNPHKGGIVADSALDHLHSDRKKTAKSLWIFGMVRIVIGACLLVTWFLKTWINK